MDAGPGECHVGWHLWAYGGGNRSLLVGVTAAFVPSHLGRAAVVHSALRPGEVEIRALLPLTSIPSPTPTPCPGTTGLEPALGSWLPPSTSSHKTSMRGCMNELGRSRELHTERSSVLHARYRTGDPLRVRACTWKVRAPAPALPKKSPLCRRESSGGKP